MSVCWEGQQSISGKHFVYMKAYVSVHAVPVFVHHVRVLPLCQYLKYTKAHIEIEHLKG